MIKIGRIGNDPTISFAVEELFSYLQKADRHADVVVLARNEYLPRETNVLWVGRDPAFALPAVDNTQLDDAISIRVQDFTGVITGANNRAVLIAVYRFLKELGFNWVRPGADGDVIPDSLSYTHSVSISTVPTCRHRGICIEGAVSYTHVKNMLAWIPRVGMNAYYTQFFTPWCFYDRWYSHRNNPLYTPTPLSRDEIDALNTALIEEVNKRSLLYHATGHGWTCEPFGMEGTDWAESTREIPVEVKQYLAMLNGERKLFGGVALNTNLCYSNPVARDAMTTAIVQYCQNHPEVSYLHFWLADGINNQCECDDCNQKRPADWYVMLLNELDEKLTQENLPTRVVFLIYVDLLWEPRTEAIRNQDRFVLMFAPITRSYLKAFADFDKNEQVNLAPYVRNKLKMPAGVAENVTRLHQWKKMFKGDSFDFDYHLMWNHVVDPGYTNTARILHKDMQNLHSIGLNGMVSCQLQRVAFPTCLPMYAMANALFDASLSFEEISRDYYRSAFGAHGTWVENYLKDISDYFAHPDITPYQELDIKQRAHLAKELALKSEPVIRAGYEQAAGARKYSWYYLLVHVQYVVLNAEYRMAREQGDEAVTDGKINAVIEYLCQMEPEIESVADVGWMIHSLKKQRRRHDI
ncbi:MAG TPA: hypothetical protein DCY74_06000 [Clostridiales bacterium]|nr:hypothetical protein [Clostridiales bacterium]